MLCIEEEKNWKGLCIQEVIAVELEVVFALSTGLVWLYQHCCGYIKKDFVVIFQGRGGAQGRLRCEGCSFRQR